MKKLHVSLLAAAVALCAPVVNAIRRVTDVCTAAGMPLGYFGVSAAAVQPYVERGYTLIVAGVDTLFLGQGARTLLADLREASGTAGA